MLYQLSYRGIALRARPIAKAKGRIYSKFFQQFQQAARAWRAEKRDGRVLGERGRYSLSWGMVGYLLGRRPYDHAPEFLTQG